MPNSPPSACSHSDPVAASDIPPPARLASRLCGASAARGRRTSHAGPAPVLLGTPTSGTVQAAFRENASKPACAPAGFPFDTDQG